MAVRKYDTVLFDLDGTLTDPGMGITNSVIYALERFEITVVDRSELYRFIGPPLLDSFEKYYGFTEKDAKKAVKYYREYYTEKGIYENLLYEGVRPMLKRISESGMKILLATSKPEPFAKQILIHFGIMDSFDLVSGALLDETRTAKDAVIAHALAESGISAESAVMVGDRKYDIIGAKKNRLASVGVLYGYGSREELQCAGADRLANDISELETILIARKVNV